VKKYTALLLAAGHGSRIADVTTGPKSLIEVNGKALIDHHFLNFKAVGIRDVVIVTGFKRELLENYLEKYQADFNIQFALNEDYKVKGNTYSFLYGIKKISEAFLLFDADLIYETEILKSFVEEAGENQILVGESSIDDIECAKAMVDRHQNVRMTIDKRAVTEEERAKYTFAGEAIGILKFSQKYRDDMENALQDFLSREENISKNWEHVMNEFLLTHDMQVFKTNSSRWVEIDNREDLNRAKEIFECL